MIESLMATLQLIFWFVVIISVIVVVHELGHYYAARFFGIRVEVFSLGFGPELFAKLDKLGTRWRLALFPLGGYVKMFGDVNPASAPDFNALKQLPKSQQTAAFYFKPLWQKAIVVFAGPFANYLFAFVVMSALFMSYGKIVIPAVVGEAVSNMPAAQAGLKTGDEILAVDGEKVHDFLRIKQKIMLNTGEQIEFLIKRDGRELIANITPIIEQQKDEVTGSIISIPLVGISPQGEGIRVQFSFGEALGEAGVFIYNTSISMLKAVWQLITWQRGLDDLGGPVKIAKYTNHSASQGFIAVLWVMVLLSINLGLLNLLPIPLLDGGHLAFYLVEGLIGRPIPPLAQSIAFRVGYFIIASLMFIAISSDIKSLFLS